MHEYDRMFSMGERLEIELEIANECGGLYLIKEPICTDCVHRIADAYHCKMYVEENKPRDVIRALKECPMFKHKNSLDMIAATDLHENVLGGTFGFCIGDALGVPVEFSTREERLSDPVNEMRAYGVYYQPFGTWSDDSSLMLCLMENLTEGYSLKQICMKFIKYLMEGYWTPYGKMFDIGNATKAAIVNMKIEVDPVQCGGRSESDNGNGSLMRILPLAYYTRNWTNREQLRIIDDVSSLTHAHRRSVLACIIYVKFAGYLLSGCDKNTSYENTINFIKSQCREQYGHEFKRFIRILDKSIISLPKEQIKSSGYVVSTLEAVFWAFFNTENYQSSVFEAINLGGDTDTIAAITGGLSGIYYGLNSIPENWIQCAARKKDIYDLCLRFAQKCQ